MSDSATPWTAACQASLSFTVSRGLVKLMSIELMMPSNQWGSYCLATWETGVPGGREHKIVGQLGAVPDASTASLQPYSFGQSSQRVPLLDSRHGDVDLLMGEWQDHIAENRQTQERWLQPSLQNTVDHTSLTISSAFPVCSYSKRQSALGLILYMEQLPNINSLITPDIFKVSHKQI